jgi:hypothetical protein
MQLGYDLLPTIWMYPALPNGEATSAPVMNIFWPALVNCWVTFVIALLAILSNEMLPVRLLLKCMWLLRIA